MTGSLPHPGSRGGTPGDGEDRTLSASGGSARKEDPQGCLSELEWESVVGSGRGRAGNQVLHCGACQF